MQYQIRRRKEELGPISSMHLAPLIIVDVDPKINKDFGQGRPWSCVRVFYHSNNNNNKTYISSNSYGQHQRR